MTALLIRRRRPIGENAPPFLAIRPTVHFGTAGAGRVMQALADLRLPLQDLAQLALDADLRPADLDAMDVADRFGLVILGSHLINVPDERGRLALLDLARRHLGPGGSVLVEHHPVDWAETAAAVRPTPGGSDLGMLDVRRHPPFVSAVSVYDVGGRVVRQPFQARVLSDPELDRALAMAGLARTTRLAATWLAAEPSGAPAQAGLLHS